MPCCNVNVNFTHRDLLQDIVGNDVMDDFQESNTADYCDLFREFEVKKRKYSNANDKLFLRVPIALSECFQKKRGKSIKDYLATQQRYRNNISWTADKLKLEPDVAKTVFENVCKSATNHMQSLFQRPEVKDVQTVLMVGGFSESPMLQDLVQKALPEKQVIIPSEPGMAVLKGAVIFGHDPSVIQERRCRFTYGVETSMPFQPGDPIDKKFTDDDGGEYCRNKFDVHVHVGQAVVSGGEQRWQSYSVTRRDQNTVPLKFFATEDKEPNFTTDLRCKQIGQLTVQVPGSGMGRSVRVRMIFGDTELHAEAIEEQTDRQTSATLNFLG